MNMYQMIHGVNPVTFFVLPVLGMHPDDIPRFRDCFLADEEYPEYGDGYIHVYTRVGGGNRDCGMGEEELQKHPQFVTDWDDSFDSTYATYLFSVPEQFKEAAADFAKHMDPKKLDPLLQAEARKVYPKLADTFDELWGKEDSA